MATIFDSIRPVQMPDPVEQQGRLYQLMALQDRAETGQLQREQMRRAMAKEGRLAALMGQVNGDAELAAPLLYKEGMFAEANTLLKARRDADESRYKADSAKADAAAKKLDVFGRVLGSVVDDPTPQRAEAAMAQIRSLLPGVEIPMPTDGDIKGWAQRGVEMALSARDKQGKFGAPVQGTGPDGRPVFFQPNQMGGPARVMEGVTPPENDEFARALRAAGIDPKSPEGMAMARRYLDKKTTHQPATNISVNTEKTLFGDIAAGQGKDINATFEQARGAIAQFPQIQRLVAALKSGNVNVGFGADAKQMWDRIGVTMGIAGNNASERVQNTQAIVKALAKADLDGAKLLAGQGQVTENERALVSKAESGQVSFSVPELMQLAQMMDWVARAKVKRAIEYRDALQKSPNAAPLLPFIANIQEPPQIDFNAASPAAQNKAWQNRPPLEAFQR